jgi:hypothetical protein
LFFKRFPVSRSPIAQPALALPFFANLNIVSDIVQCSMAASLEWREKRDYGPDVVPRL